MNLIFSYSEAYKLIKRLYVKVHLLKYTRTITQLTQQSKHPFFTQLTRIVAFYQEIGELVSYFKSAKLGSIEWQSNLTERHHVNALKHLSKKNSQPKLSLWCHVLTAFDSSFVSLLRRREQVRWNGNYTRGCVADNCAVGRVGGRKILARELLISTRAISHCSHLGNIGWLRNVHIRQIHWPKLPFPPTIQKKTKTNALISALESFIHERRRSRGKNVMRIL